MDVTYFYVMMTYDVGIYYVYLYVFKLYDFLVPNPTFLQINIT